MGGAVRRPIAAHAAQGRAVASAGGGALAAAIAPGPAPERHPLSPPPASITPMAAGLHGTQLADQFRQSVEASAASVEEGPEDGWFVGVNGVPLGPIPVGDVRELAAAGHVDRKSLVWREGQAEWRPLGKFPFLVRLLDETSGAHSAAGITGTTSSAAGGGAHGNGVNGHAAVGFDVRSELRKERPSAWGDLDEEDDEDEQPTTVKGRVSVPPPPEPAPMAPGPVGAPLASMGSRAHAVGPASALSAPPPEGPASTISGTPEPIVESAAARAMRPGGNRWYTWLAVAAALVLGAVLMHVFGSTGSEVAPSRQPAPEPARALAPALEESPAPQQQVAEEASPASRSDEAQPSLEEPNEEPASMAQPVTKPASSGVVPVSPPEVAMAKPKPTGSLLSGLGAPQTPGPNVGARTSGGSSGGGAGLEATAIQRTVRRYSPAVRQNCWQRALNARAPGVPSSAKVTAQITVEPSGRVQSVRVSGAPRGYPGLAGCIESSVRGWTFPRAAGETITNVPFMFVGQ